MSELESLVPNGYRIVDRKAFERAVKMAPHTGTMPEQFPDLLAKKPHVVRLWGLEKIEMEGAA